MNKLEQAARQTLSADDALMTLELILRDGIEHGNWPLNKNCEDGLEAITTLREALAEPDIEEMTLTQIAARHEQAEQEPVGVVEGSGEWGIAGVLVAGVPIGTKLYAAPVRTKDLTDEEQLELARSSVGKSRHWLVAAVIAAYKEKNK